MANNQTTARLQISRLRVGTDGDGVRTLVSFYGCPLDCKYCLNPQLRKDDETGKLYTPKELFDEIIRDRYYFLTTRGGVTFSGGEPLLHPDFIREFCELCKDEEWDVNVETSLAVNAASVEEVAGLIHMFIVDIKDTNPDIYSRYTGESLNPVLTNLAYLNEIASPAFGTEVLVRIPLIPGYNSKEDVKKSFDFLRKTFECFSVQRFKYILPDEKRPEPNGKRICEILKAIRQGLINENGLDIKQPICTNKGNCPGTCPVCEAKMDMINNLLGKDGKYSDTQLDMTIGFEKYLFKHTGIVESNVGRLLGIVTPPEYELMGDVKIQDEKSFFPEIEDDKE